MKKNKLKHSTFLLTASLSLVVINASAVVDFHPKSNTLYVADSFENTGSYPSVKPALLKYKLDSAHMPILSSLVLLELPNKVKAKGISFDDAGTGYIIGSDKSLYFYNNEKLIGKTYEFPNTPRGVSYTGNAVYVVTSRPELLKCTATGDSCPTIDSKFAHDPVGVSFDKNRNGYLVVDGGGGVARYESDVYTKQIYLLDYGKAISYTGNAVYSIASYQAGTEQVVYKSPLDLNRAKVTHIDGFSTSKAAGISFDESGNGIIDSYSIPFPMSPKYSGRLNYYTNDGLVKELEYYTCDEKGVCRYNIDPVPRPTPTPAPIIGPEILGYYTNWSTYDAKYQPKNIPAQVDTILYAFAQVGECNTVSISATEQNPSLCNSQVNSSGVNLQRGAQDWSLHTTDAWSDFYIYKNHDGVNIGGLGNISKTLATGKKVLLSIGGWSLSAPIGTAINDDHRTAFIQSIIDFMHLAEADAKQKGVNKKFAGVDVDWEPNGNLWTLPSTDPKMKQLTKIDLQNYAKFLQDLKAALKSNGYSTLSIAMTANPKAIANVDQVYGDKYWKQIADLGVKMNLMTYDYNSQGFAGKCKYTQFNSPLWNNPNNPCDDAKGMDINDSVLALTNEGVVTSAIGIGIPAYGHAYALNDINDVTNSNPYAEFYSQITLTNPAVTNFGDIWTNRQILTGYAYGSPDSGSEKSTWVKMKDDFSIGQAYATGWISYNGVGFSKPGFITYTSNTSAQSIMQFAKSKGLNSVMLWSLDQDLQPSDGDAGKISWDRDSIINGLYIGRSSSGLPKHKTTISTTANKPPIAGTRALPWLMSKFKPLSRNGIGKVKN